MTRHVCTLCRWMYNPERGLLEKGIPPGTSFEDLPDDFVCPECNATKQQFVPVQPRTTQPGG